MSLVRVRNLRLSFRGADRKFEVLRGVDLTIAAGQITGLVGESGSGKTLTGLSLIGLAGDRAEIQADALVVDGTDLLSSSKNTWRRLRGQSVSMIFQNPTSCLDPHYRIGSQMTEVLCVRGGHSSSSAKRHALHLLEEVGLSDGQRVMRSFPHELSGGMNQRVMIALAIALEPKLVIADEPTTALDVTTQSRILEMFRGLARKRQMAVLFISHDLGVVHYLCDSVAVLYAGRVVESGAVVDVVGAAKHPYTEALLQARPRLGGEPRPPQGISGHPPQVGEEIVGCAFAPRCTQALPQCQSQIPVMTRSKSHAVACLLNHGEGLR